MELFDTHCHLNSEQLYADRDNYIKRAQEKGVKYFLVVGYDKESSLKAISIAEEYDFVYAAIGFHPTELDFVSEDFDEITSLLKHPKVVALGEIGLDYYWVKEEKEQEKQKQYFIKQINIANDNNLPIIVHNRDAFEDCLNILKEHTPKMGGVMHCYSGPADKVKDIVKLGMFVSFGGPVTFLNGRRPKEAATITPLDMLLLETDCPYLSPHPYRGKTNEPANVALVANEVASLHNLRVEELGVITTKNAKKLFHIE